MSPKALSSKNPYLKELAACQRVVVNVSTSTAIETGKPARTYVQRVASKKIVAKSVVKR